MILLQLLCNNIWFISFTIYIYTYIYIYINSNICENNILLTFSSPYIAIVCILLTVFVWFCAQEDRAR